MRGPTSPIIAMLAVLGCEPYLPIPAEDPCVSSKVVCGEYMSEPAIVLCAVPIEDDGGGARYKQCPDRTRFLAPGQHLK